MKRLKQSEVSAARSEQVMNQLWICPVCRKKIDALYEVFDHSHQTGKMRGVLHRNCNCLLGRIENNCRRHCVPFADLPNWLRGAADYLERPHLEVYHPSFKTEDEKRLLRNKRAAKKRKAKK